MGIKNNSHGEIISKKIVKITKEGRPNGPAEHSIIIIESSSTNKYRTIFVLDNLC